MLLDCQKPISHCDMICEATLLILQNIRWMTRVDAISPSLLCSITSTTLWYHKYVVMRRKFLCRHRHMKRWFTHIIFVFECVSVYHVIIDLICFSETRAANNSSRDPKYHRTNSRPCGRKQILNHRKLCAKRVWCVCVFSLKILFVLGYFYCFRTRSTYDAGGDVQPRLGAM